MAEIHLDHVAHSYLPRQMTSADWALKELDHVWEDGAAYALLGPSGCGKTTLLNVISGLISPSQGQVRFDGRDVTTMKTEHRNIAQVFQFPVIYDTMSVYDNLAFPLRNRGIDEATVRDRVLEVAEMLDLAEDLRKRALGLPADAKQKISLGRGLVRSDVAAILFDEPLTVIDPHLKWQLRRKLKQIHDRYKLTLIYVTHDQNEALTFAEKVAVMYEGAVLQVGTPQELFEAPAHRFIGYFIGSPGMNFLPCELTGDGARVAGQTVVLPPGVPARAGKAATLEIGIRPEAVSLAEDGAGDGGGLAAQVRGVEDLGSCKIVTCRLDDYEIKVKVPEDQPVPPDRCALSFNRDLTLLYADGRLVD